MKVIITGSTGMVGEGVLYVCLQNPEIENVLILNRNTLGLTHPKLKEIIIPDFFDLTSIESDLDGYDACFFCLGTSSIGMKPEDYFNVTYNLTMNFADLLSRLNPQMTFCYISGAGTDGTERGKIAWARVKGKTENDLVKLPFKRVFNLRPGFIKPIKGLKNTLKFYKYITWIFPLGKLISPNMFISMEELGTSMIKLALEGYNKNVLNGKDISEVSKS